MNRATVGSGIYYGWLIVAASFFISFLTVGGRNGFGVFVIPMSEDFSWDRGTISLAASIGFLLNGLSQPFIGRLYDRVGGRRLILISLVVIGVSNLLLAATNHIIFLIIVFGVVMAIAMSGGSLNTTVSIISKWFEKKRAMAVAIIAAGAPAGGLILVPLSSYLIQLAGWRTTWAVLGVMVLALAVPLAYFIMRERPEDMGLLPDGASAPTGAGGRASTLPLRAPLESDRWLSSFGSSPMWQLSGAYFVCGFTTALISAHFVPFAIEEGYSQSMAASAFGVMSGLNVAGVMLAGAMGDRFGRKNLLALVYMVRAGAYVTLLMVPGLLGLWSFAIVAGFSWIATVPLTTSLTADVYGLRNIGILGGIVFTAHQFGGAISIQLAGVLRDLTGSYETPLIIGAVLLVGASLLSYSIREKKYSARYQPSGPVAAAPQGT